MGSNHVTVAWEPPDDGDAPVSDHQYGMEVCTAGDCGLGDTDIKAATSTSARINGLTTDGRYSFDVRAVNPEGEGEWAYMDANLSPSLTIAAAHPGPPGAGRLR